MPSMYLLLRVALGEPPDRPLRLPIAGVQHSPETVGTDPPQCGPVGVVVMVNEHRNGGVLAHVREPPERGRALGLRIHGAVDLIIDDRENDRHEVWPAGRVGGR
jgi:hypothetical protein